MANTQTQPTQPTVALVPPTFGMPGGSLELVGTDTTNALPITLNESSQTSQQLAAMQNTDVIRNYRLQVGLAVTPPSNSTTASDVVASSFLPIVGLSKVELKVQNVFTPLDSNGIDLMVKNLVWPSRDSARTYDNAFSTGIQYPSGNESRLYGADAYSSSATALTSNLYWDLGPAQHFTRYYEVDLNSGLPIATNGVISQRLYAGVQYLGGTTRVITCTPTFAPLLGSNDVNGFYSGTATTNGSGTATVSVIREGWFSSSDLSMMPAVTSWMPVFQTQQITVGAQPEWTYELPKSYQVLGMVFRFFDLGSNSPMSVSNLEEMKVQVGSGITLFDGSASLVQKRLYDKIGLLANVLPQGTFVYDLLHDDNGDTTNAFNINTYTTNGAIVRFKFANAGTSQFTCFASIYGLQYVEQGSGL
jgi:hypothetical protein